MLCSRPQESGLEYTFIRVGEIVEGKEGGSVMVGNVTDALPVEQVVRDDIIRLSAEAFVMENTTNTVSCALLHYQDCEVPGGITLYRLCRTRYIHS